MCGVLPHNIYDYLFLPALLSSTPTSLGMRLELWRMEDHPGTGVWSVVCGCSIVISTQCVTPKMNFACNCDQWFLCGVISIATNIPLCTTGALSVVCGCSNVAVSTCTNCHSYKDVLTGMTSGHIDFLYNLLYQECMIPVWNDLYSNKCSCVHNRLSLDD